jgi:hypothetical protein
MTSRPAAQVEAERRELSEQLAELQREQAALHAMDGQRAARLAQVRRPAGIRLLCELASWEIAVSRARGGALM